MKVLCLSNLLPFIKNNMHKFNFISQETNLLTYLITSETSSDLSTQVTYDTSSEFLSKLFSSAYPHLLKEGLIELSIEGNVKITQSGRKALTDAAQNLQKSNIMHTINSTDLENCTLIFARAIGLLLQKNEGIVVDLMSNMKLGDSSITSVIVLSRGGQIHIIPNEYGYPHKKFISVVDNHITDNTNKSVDIQ